MPRSLSAPGYSQGFNGPLPVGFGGTGSNTASGALESLGGVSKSQILDPVTGKIKQDAIVGGGVGGGTGGGGDSWTYVAITANATLTPFAIGHVKTAGVTVKLPASPVVNTRVRVVVDDFTNTNLDGNGSSILGVTGELFEIDTANQVIELGYFDTWRLISSSIIGAVAGSTPTATTSDVSVMGPVSLVVNEVGVYKITNFDIGTTYAVSSTMGTVSVSLDTITYLPGAVAGNGGFTINGKQISIEILSSRAIGSKVTKITPVGNSAYDIFGVNLKISPDEKLLLVSRGQIGTANYIHGFVDVFDKANIDQGPVFILPVSPSYPVGSIACSFDGSVIAVGRPNNGSSLNAGQVDIISYDGKKAYVSASLQVAASYLFGSRVFLSENGQELLVKNSSGDYSHLVHYSKSGNTWTKHQALVAMNLGVAPATQQQQTVSGDFSTIFITGVDGQQRFLLDVRVVNAGEYEPLAGYVNLAPSEVSTVPNSSGYGSSIACSKDGTLVVVGAAPSKAVYVQRKSGTAYPVEQKITPPSGYTAMTFGANVAVSPNGKFLAVRDGKASDFTSEQGVVFIYKETNGVWNLVKTVWNNEGFVTSSDMFGGEMVFNNDGSILYITAPYKENNAGVVYVLS